MSAGVMSVSSQTRLQGALRQVVVAVLDRLQNRDHGLAPRPALGDDLFNATQVKFGYDHARFELVSVGLPIRPCLAGRIRNPSYVPYFAPMQNRWSCPRM